MARRNRGRDLAGLAALGALGFMAGKGLYKRAGEELAPVEDRMPAPAPSRDRQETFMGLDDTGAGASDMSGDTGDFLSRRLRVNPETGEAYSMDNVAPMGRQTAAPRAARPADRMPADRMSAAAADAMYANRPSAASMRAPINDREQVFDAPMRPADPRLQAAASAPSARRMTREELIAQIPTGGYPTVEGGERVSGNEFTRNVGNILNAPVPGVMPFGRMIGRGATTGRAATGREVGFLNETPVTYLGTSSRAAQSGPTAAIGGGSSARAALNAPRAELGAPPRRLGSPTQRLSGPSATSLKEAERAARAEKLREQVLKENAAAYGLNPNAPGYEAAMRALRKNLGGDEFTLKKKGGAIKAKPKKMASGGMSSASKRADGIASKGKTKCKMY